MLGNEKINQVGSFTYMVVILIKMVGVMKMLKAEPRLRVFFSN